MTNAERAVGTLRNALNRLEKRAVFLGGGDLEFSFDFALRMRLRNQKGQPLSVTTNPREALTSGGQTPYGMHPGLLG
jgi:hypothetical protein